MRSLSNFSSFCWLLLALLGLFAVPSAAQAQHTRWEFGFEGAIGGQLPFGEANRGFFTKPIIIRIRGQAVTDGRQSLAVFYESVKESRTRRGRWPEGFVSPSEQYLADITETVGIFSIGGEYIHTAILTGPFRLGIGFGLGLGFGTSSPAEVSNLTTGETSFSEGCGGGGSVGIVGSVFTRGRLTLYSSEFVDIGLTATVRYWGMPLRTFATDCLDGYNAPDVSRTQELGYLAGLSVGF